MQEQLLNLANHAIEVFASVLMLVATLALQKFAVWMKTKTSIEVADSAEIRIRETIEDAIDYAEEIARQKAKEQILLFGEDKLKIAIDFVQNVVGVSPLEARARIESTLQRKRSLGDMQKQLAEVVKTLSEKPPAPVATEEDQ